MNKKIPLLFEFLFFMILFCYPISLFLGLVFNFYISPGYLYNACLFILCAFGVWYFIRGESKHFPLLILAFFILFNGINYAINFEYLSWIKTIKNFLIFPALASALIYYCRNSSIDRLKRILYLASVISVIYCGLEYLDIITVKIYQTKLRDYFLDHMPGYFEYTKGFVGLWRPMGIFFDLHSQYYLMIFGLIMTLSFPGSKLLKKIFFLLFFLFGIFISSVRTSYILALVFVLIWIFETLYFILKYKRLNRDVFVIMTLFFVSSLIIFIKSDFFLFLIRVVLGLEGKSSQIIQSHAFEIPMQTLAEEPICFFIGGCPELRTSQYSEVYFWSLTYYIGMIGMLFINIPFIYYTTQLLKGKINYAQVSLYFKISLLFILSLIHYKVFNSCLNTVITALSWIPFIEKSFFNKTHKIVSF